MHHIFLPGKLFLAGSIHLGKKELYPLDKAYDDALKKSDILVFEIFEEDEEKSRRFNLKFLDKKASYAPGKNLKQVMGEKDYLLLASYFQSRGSIHFSNNDSPLRPWFVMLTLVQIAAQDSKLEMKYGFEEVFKKLRQKRPARGLEKTYTQLSMLEGTDEKLLCKIIIDGIRNPLKQKKELENIIECFRTGNIAPLAAQTEEMRKKYPLFHKRLLYTRNLNMTDSLAKFAEEKKTFFVIIGAAHFAGKGNILQLLEEKGFTVKQMAKTGKAGTITGENDDSK